MADATLHTFRASDGYSWYYRHYAAVGRPRGRVVFLHGIRSHGGWYARSCAEIAATGFEVSFLDRRGAGLNTARRGDAPEFRRLLDDVGEFLHDLRQSKPWLPLTLAGISWGGKLAAAIPYRHPGLIDALTLLCPGLCPKVSPPLGQRIGIARGRVRNPTKYFPVPLNEPDYFTASPEWQAWIDKDRHGLKTATARFLFSSASLDIYLKRAIPRVTVPSLLMLASEDRVIDNAATRALFARFGTAARTVIEYPGAQHTLEFEPAECGWVGDLAGWLNSINQKPM